MSLLNNENKANKVVISFTEEDRKDQEQEMNPLIKSNINDPDGVQVLPKFPTNLDDFREPDDETIKFGADEAEEATSTIKSNKHIFPQVASAIAVSIASMMVGFSSAYTSPALASMDMPNSTLNVTEDEKSWIGSLMPLSALAGSFLGGYLTESIGRRASIIACGPPLFVASMIIGSAVNVWMVYAGRVIIGTCIGLLSLSMPVYLGEITQAKIRGTLSLLPTSIGNGGILTCYLIGAFVDWSVLAYLGGLIPLTFTILMCLIPETPRWLLSKGRNDAATESLRWLRGPDLCIRDEMKVIEENINATANQKSSYKQIFNRQYLRPICISLGLMMFQQLSGINAVIFYSVDIFRHAGSSLDSNLCTVIVGAVNIISTFIANVLIDKLGRKILLLASSSLMILSLIVLAGYFYLKEILALKSDSKEYWNDIVSQLGWLPLVCLMTYVLAFSLGWGPLPWLFVGEGLPNKIRGPAGSLVIVCNWSSSFFVTKTFPGMVISLGAFGVFLLFAGIMLLALLFTVIVFPETKGLTLEEIETKLSKPCCGCR